MLVADPHKWYRPAVPGQAVVWRQGNQRTRKITKSMDNKEAGLLSKILK
ncbi:MAG: hypothetical protein K0R62_5942 [Nonomuraea muscovyensis]|jgi:hypothetical protein|nr:hypothetical protein [Nonomuraea muscovyensis]